MSNLVAGKITRRDASGIWPAGAKGRGTSTIEHRTSNAELPFRHRAFDVRRWMLDVRCLKTSAQAALAGARVEVARTSPWRRSAEWCALRLASGLSRLLGP